MHTANYSLATYSLVLWARRSRAHMEGERASGHLTGFRGCCRNVGDTNQIAEFVIIAFTFCIGHMNSIFQMRMSGDSRAACP